MKRTILALLISFIIFPSIVFAATVNDPGDIRVKDSVNSLPTTNLMIIFANDTTGNSEAFGLGEYKISCHEWQIESDKLTADVDWTIALQGSLDNSYYETFDSTTSVVNWQRHIKNYGYNWIRSNVQRTYTGIAPTVTIKHQAGCN
jgi:hypothetical protein